MARSKNEKTSGGKIAATKDAPPKDAGSLPVIGAEWVEAMVDINSEVGDFIAGRIKENVKTQRELVQCKTAEDFQKAQVAFLETAYKQYAIEAGKLIKMGQEMLPIAVTDSKDKAE